MPKLKPTRAIAQEIDRVLDGIKSLDAEARDYIRPMLEEDVLESMLPGEVVLEHIRSRHEIVRDYSFPEGSGDDEAMFLIQYQAAVGEDYLRSFAKAKNPPCEHFPQFTSGPNPSRMFTIKEQAASALKTIEEQLIKDAPPAETTPQIEAVVERMMARTFSDVENEQHRKLIADAYRDSLLVSTDPAMVIRRRLSRYENADGTVSIPKEERLDRALHLLLIRRDVATAALTLIASSKLSCGDHDVVYAGGVKSEGNRIFTAQKVAKNGLKDLAERGLLEHRPVKDVLRELLADLTGSD